MNIDDLKGVISSPGYGINSINKPRLATCIWTINAKDIVISFPQNKLFSLNHGDSLTVSFT